MGISFGRPIAVTLLIACAVLLGLAALSMVSRRKDWRAAPA